jgi:hypothetical protein
MTTKIQQCLFDLRVEIAICENLHVEPCNSIVTWDQIEDAFNYYKHISSDKRIFRVENFNWLYDQVFKLHPIIKTRLSKEVFESWAITHDVEDLRKLLRIKNESKIS